MKLYDVRWPSVRSLYSVKLLQTGIGVVHNAHIGSRGEEDNATYTAFNDGQ